MSLYHLSNHSVFIYTNNKIEAPVVPMTAVLENPQGKYVYKMDEDNQPILLESKPRVQGTMVMSTFCGANIIYSSIKAILGEDIPQLKIDWNTQLFRYWGAIGVNNNGIVRI